MTRSAQCASVTVFRQGAPKVLLATSAVSSGAETIQREVGEGPGLEAVLSGNVYLSRDLASEHQWPVFAAAVRERLGLNSVLTHRVPLSQEPETIVGLSLFSDTPDAFDGQDVWASAVMATHCALTVTAQVYRNKIASMEHALVQNGSLGAAVEVLAARHEISASRALETLRRLSRDRQQDLSEVAAEVIRTEHSPTPRNRAKNPSANHSQYPPQSTPDTTAKTAPTSTASSAS